MFIVNRNRYISFNDQDFDFVCYAECPNGHAYLVGGVSSRLTSNSTSIMTTQRVNNYDINFLVNYVPSSMTNNLLFGLCSYSLLVSSHAVVPSTIHCISIFFSLVQEEAVPPLRRIPLVKNVEHLLGE